MQTECSADLFGFAPVEGRKVVAAFDGGTMTSEAGAMLLGATDRQIRLIERFAGCFTDHRVAELAEISQTGRCIGALDLRKSCCTNGLSQDPGESRCR